MFHRLDGLRIAGVFDVGHVRLPMYATGQGYSRASKLSCCAARSTLLLLLLILLVLLHVMTCCCCCCHGAHHHHHHCSAAWHSARQYQNQHAQQWYSQHQGQGSSNEATYAEATSMAHVHPTRTPYTEQLHNTFRRDCIPGALQYRS